MPDTFFWGKRGSGKTLMAIIQLWLDYWEGRQIWTNTPLDTSFDYNPMTRKNGNLKLIDVADLIELLVDDDASNEITQIPKTLLLDEMKGQANSRLSMTFINRNLGHFVSQARKWGFKMIYTDAILGGYDKWIREMTDTITKCTPTISFKDIGLGTYDYPEPLKFNYIEWDTYDWKVKNRYSILRKTARYFYPLYDTAKRITPAELKYAMAGEST